MSKASIELQHDLSKIGAAIYSLAKDQKQTLRKIAKSTGLSINSVKVVFSGKTGTITTYDTVARYLGTSLFEVAYRLESDARSRDKHHPLSESESHQPVQAVDLFPIL